MDSVKCPWIGIKSPVHPGHNAVKPPDLPVFDRLRGNIVEYTVPQPRRNTQIFLPVCPGVFLLQKPGVIQKFLSQPACRHLSVIRMMNLPSRPRRSGPTVDPVLLQRRRIEAFKTVKRSLPPQYRLFRAAYLFFFKLIQLLKPKHPRISKRDF